MNFDPVPFELRRKAFAEQVGEGLAVLVGARMTSRNYDVDHPFRQNSDFHFLTGFPEPDAVAVINPSHPSERYVLFVHPRNRDEEIWDGWRAGVEGAREIYGADAAYSLDELDSKLKQYSVGRTTLFYQPGYPDFDRRMLELLGTGVDKRGQSGNPMPVRIEDPSHLLAEARLIKTEPEIANLRRACEISSQAHAEAMRHIRPGMYEYQIQAVLEFVFRTLGAARDGYPSIVGSGPNSCILHYVENRRRMEDGELLLVDAGCEYEYFAADVTRTFPVNGRFTAPQRAVFDVVLAAQNRAMEAVRPGLAHTELHQIAKRTVTEGLVELGLLPLSVEESLEFGHYREFFMHGTSHWLGLDVHDAGAYRVEGGGGRLLEPGMVFTVEPGIYIDPARGEVSLPLLRFDEDRFRERRGLVGLAEATKELNQARAEASQHRFVIPSEFLGIGVRLEDDVLVTSTGGENLSASCPRTPAEIEATCAEPSRMGEW